MLQTQGSTPQQHVSAPNQTNANSNANVMNSSQVQKNVFLFSNSRIAN